MNDHNLDDLIIDTIEPKSAKTKSALTIFALLIVVVIVGIVLFRIISDGTSTNNNPYGDNNSLSNESENEMVEPELRLAKVSKKAEKKTPQVEEMINDNEESGNKEPKLNKIIEEELNKPVTDKKPETPVILEAETVPVETVKKETHEIEVKPVVVTTPKVDIQAVDITSESEQEPEVVKETVTEKAPVAVPEVKEPVKKASTAKAVTHEPAAAAHVSYYIQVGAYKQSPSKQLIRSIKNNGFNYKLTAPSARGTKKLLIGPYSNRNSVDNALVRVRDHINKSAFVIKR